MTETLPPSFPSRENGVSHESITQPWLPIVNRKRNRGSMVLYNGEEEEEEEEEEDHYGAEATARRINSTKNGSEEMEE